MDLDAELFARLSAHRVAFTFLVKSLEGNGGIAPGRMATLLKDFLAESAESENADDLVHQIQHDELQGILHGLESDGTGPRWTPRVIQGDKK